MLNSRKLLMILQMPNKTGDGAQTIRNIPGSQAATLKESDEEEYARYMRPKSAEELGAKLNPSPAVLLAKYGTAPFCHRFTYYVSDATCKAGWCWMDARCWMLHDNPIIQYNPWSLREEMSQMSRTSNQLQQIKSTGPTVPSGGLCWWSFIQRPPRPRPPRPPSQRDLAPLRLRDRRSALDRGVWNMAGVLPQNCDFWGKSWSTVGIYIYTLSHQQIEYSKNTGQQIE